MKYFALFPLAIATVALAQAPAKKPLPPETDMSHDGWFAEMPPALAEARKTGKDMLIDFGGSDWCAPCKWLKENILTKPEFNEKAAQHFVRVDIDALARGLSPARKARYVALQKQYRVGSFPSVFLTTAEGEPYAWTTYVPATESRNVAAMSAAARVDNPERFWRQIQPLIERGKFFREGLARAKDLSSVAKADAMIDAFSQVRADFLLWFYPGKIEELKALDPADHRGFLAYLSGCRAYTELEDKIVEGGHGLNPDVKVSDVDALIESHHLKGETLQQALLMKATLLVVAGEPHAALMCLHEFVAAQKGRGEFDRGDYLPLDTNGLVVLKQGVDDALAKRDNPVAQYLDIQNIFESRVPNRYEISCHASGTIAFEPSVVLRKPISDGYGRALLSATLSLEGEARARALARGLEGTHFGFDHGPLEEIVLKIIPELVGKEKAAEILPGDYKHWDELAEVVARLHSKSAEASKNP